MKPKTMILMGVAVVCGLVASYMTSRLIAENKEEVKVLVVTQDVPAGTPIRDPEKMLTEKTVYKTQARANYVSADQIKSVKDWQIKSALKAGDQISRDDMIDADKTGVDSRLPPGMRAVSVEISAGRASGGHIIPGTKVDVIHVVGGTARVLLENIPVLAIDKNLTKTGDKQGMDGSTATLQVDPSQALKIAEARSKGEMTLVLRPNGDDTTSQSAKKDIAPVAPPMPPPPPPTIEVAAAPSIAPSIDKKEEVPLVSTMIINGHQAGYAQYTKGKNGSFQYVRFLTFEDLRNDADAKARKEKEAEKEKEEPKGSPAAELERTGSDTK